MRMRQSMASIERQFERDAALDRKRREHMRRAAVQRTRVRRRERIEKHQTLRFFGLLLSIVATAVIVTVVMFQTLAWLLG
jgi:hypothetical protein